MKKILVSTILAFSASAFADLTVYSDRPEDRIQPIADAFTKKTGEAVIIKKMSATEIEKALVDEGQNSPADVAIVKDMIYMDNLVRANMMQPLNSAFAKTNVRPEMLAEHWTAIAFRARTLVYHKSFDVSGINSYKDLADPQYAGLLCLRTSKSTYNQALGAELIASYGEEGALEILGGWLDNQVDVSNIYTSDTTLIKDIAKQDGTCTLGMTYSYYLGALTLKDPNIPVGIKFLNMKDGGSHTNGIAAGITASSKNVDLARQFVEFMLTEGPQKSFSNANQHFPANKNISFPENIKAWSTFKASEKSWSDNAELVETAKEIFEELDYL